MPSFKRSTKHHYRKFTNPGKLVETRFFVSQYETAVKFYVNYLWTAKITWHTKDKENKTPHYWDLLNDLLECPSMISTVGLVFSTALSGRALKCAATQACGIVRAVVEKRVKDLNKRDWILKNGGVVSQRLLDRTSKGLTKPDCRNINCELNSICLEIKWGEEEIENGVYYLSLYQNHFDGWVELSGIFNSEYKKRGFTLRIPIKHHKRSRKWEGVCFRSALFRADSLDIRWEVEVLPKKSGGVIALDQGKIDLFSSSDGQRSLKNNHGHDLNTILKTMSLKKNGSLAFRKCQEHRKNYINWAVNRLDLKNVKELRLEEIININFGRSTSRLMSHWTNTLVRDSIKKVCEEEGVLFRHEQNEFNSQRCLCGWVQKANRVGKKFKCKKCGLEADSDFNAAQNILIRDTLFPLPFGFRARKLNLKGFYWTPEGLISEFGEDLTVPLSQGLTDLTI